MDFGWLWFRINKSHWQSIKHATVFENTCFPKKCIHDVQICFPLTSHFLWTNNHTPYWSMQGNYFLAINTPVNVASGLKNKIKLQASKKKKKSQWSFGWLCISQMFWRHSNKIIKLGTKVVQWQLPFVIPLIKHFLTNNFFLFSIA